MLELIKRVASYSKHQRIIRIIEIAAKGENASPLEELELMMIQFIRQENGEIDEIKKEREINPID